MPKKFEERIQSSLYAGLRKHWYQHWWGKWLIGLGVLLLLLAIYYVVLVSFFYKKINSGELLDQAVDTIRQEAKIDLLHNGDDPSVGPATAPVTMVVFADFECPYSQQAQPAIKRLLAQNSGDLRIVFKDFPLPSIHPEAQSAAEAAQCAAEQGKFWEFHDQLFQNQDNFAEAYYRTVAKQLDLNITQFNECYATGKYRRQITNDVELGKSLGVVGTPTFFMNGELFAQGYSQDLDQSFQKAIEYITQL